MADRGASGARFDRWAPGYDDSELQPLLYQVVHENVLARCAQIVPAPLRLLDVGCCTGRLLRVAGSRFPGTALVGVDISGGMLSIAKATLRASTSALLVRAEVERLPIVDAAINVAIATLTYEHWSNPAAGIAEIGRVLTPGGLFALAAVLTPQRRRSPWWMHRTTRSRLPLSLAAMLAGAALRSDTVEELHGFGPIPTVTVVVARRMLDR